MGRVIAGLVIAGMWIQTVWLGSTLLAIAVWLAFRPLWRGPVATWTRADGPTTSPSPSVVRIDDAGARWIDVVRVVRRQTGLELRDARDLLAERPARFTVESRQAADAVVDRLVRLGASARTEAVDQESGTG